MQWRSLAIVSVLVVAIFTASAHAQDVSIEAWVSSFKKTAVTQGISLDSAEAALANFEPNETVIRLDRKQPEKKITLERYLENTITDRRIEKGREMLAEHRDLLAKISNEYGVHPEFIVALWAIESDFGRQQGSFSVVNSLATLAYEGRRAELFTKELISALKIIEAEKISADELTGSWAGAMGNCQFMPSTYLNYAVDGDGDGHRDIWNSVPDTFASMANYLRSIGWNAKQTNTESFEKSDNFNVLLKWNRSRYFATAVGTLAEAIGE
jgi:membrane-bound lytic murein transglycosylase B